jgi:tetratricopeptide (TPR) repeat protein
MPDADQLMDEAWDCLGCLETDRALAIGEQLIQMRYSGGFEIAALAYLQSDREDAAIKVLEKGVKEAPSVWILWQLLGNCYSDDDRYDDAMNCFQQALDCEDVDPNSVHLNIAIALGRAEHYDRSNAELNFVTSPETQPRKQAIRMGNYAGQERWEDIISEAPALLKEFEDITDAEQLVGITSDLSRIYSRWAEAYFEREEQDIEQAHITARRALLCDNQNEIALRIIRQCDNRFHTRDDSMYKLLAEGLWYEPFEGNSEPSGFYATYWVVAPSPEEALEYVKRIEPDGVGETMHIEEWDTESLAAADDFQGVYGRSSYCFFDPQS